ncbi:MAG: hypothetical protein AW12_00927 [Candidatus Accumulibacter sp. BA-94]|nr:MAG: hypothetical protein AW12_00927 [Candidatus Accumulibacter sp. BA-94]
MTSIMAPPTSSIGASAMELPRDSSLLLAAIPALAFAGCLLPLLLQRYGRAVAALAAAAVMAGCLGLLLLSWPAAPPRCRRLRRSDADLPARLAAGLGTRLQPAARRTRPALLPADSRHRHARRPLCRLVPAGDGPARAFLLDPAAVHGRHARRRAVREPAAAARLLGDHQPLLVSPRRLPQRQARVAHQRAHGAGGHRRRRSGALRRHPAARRNRRQLRTVGDPRGRCADSRRPAVRAGADPDPARRVHQVGAVSLPLLAAERDGSTDAGVGLPAFGDDGQGRGLPPRPPLPGARQQRSVVLAGQRHRCGDPRLCRGDRALPQ